MEFWHQVGVLALGGGGALIFFFIFLALLGIFLKGVGN